MKSFPLIRIAAQSKPIHAKIRLCDFADEKPALLFTRAN